MAAGAVAESPVDLVEWWPAIRRLASRRARAWDVEAEDLAQTIAVLALQRIQRGQQWWGWRTLTFCAIEASRRIQSPESRAGRFGRCEWDRIPAPSIEAQLELCALPPEPEPIEDPDDENMRHRIEWETMGLRERQARILESRRALLCSS